MATTYFIWLGSGRARRLRLHETARTIDQAAKAGLPVPPGAVLLDELLRVFLKKGLVAETNGRYIIDDPELVHNTIFHSVRLPRFERPVVARPAFPAQPTVAPRTGVDMNDAVQVAAALSILWTAAAATPGQPRADVLLMETVAAEQEGAAETRRDAPNDEIAVGGDAVAADRLSLPRLDGWRAARSAELPPYARRLQMLLRGVRRTFGRGDWRIQWVDDGRVCYLTAVAALDGQPGALA